MAVEVRSSSDNAWYDAVIKRMPRPSKTGKQLKVTFKDFPEELDELTAEEVETRVRFESLQLQVCPQETARMNRFVSVI
jgi:hypothetical protein